jgi:predicted RNA-binding Zn-ribbon protein involved in translation (DUF1610 family)
MATYCYRCVQCKQLLESSTRGEIAVCPRCGGFVARDYRSESVGVDRTSMRPDRKDFLREQAALFLPTAKDYAGPDDPDGMKGLKAWQDEMGPRPSNTKPAWPTDLAK